MLDLQEEFVWKYSEYQEKDVGQNNMHTGQTNIKVSWQQKGM